ncbi:MAG: class I SAM-dependent methyltransferase, partial [Bacteroidota bacterium]
NVLEIGCAYGFFGEVMLNEFPGSEYTGIDIARDAVEHGKNQLGLELVCGDYLNHQFPGLFSDIFMLDVIEHLERPDLYLEKAYQELKPGGRIFITTGDISRLIPRIKKQNWRLIHPPTHLHYFSRETLFKLLQAKGFIIAGILYPSITRSMKLAWYSAFMLDKKPGRFTTGIHRAIPHKMKFTMNTFDIMFVAAIRE